MRNPSQALFSSPHRLLLLAALMTLLSVHASAQIVSTFVANLDGAHAAPPNSSPGTAFGRATLDDNFENAFNVRLSVAYKGLVAKSRRIELVCQPAPGEPQIFPLALDNPGGTSGFSRNQFFTGIDPAVASALRDGRCSFVIQTSLYPQGEIAGAVLVSQPYTGSLNGAQHTPPNTSPGLGYTRVSLSGDEKQIMVTLSYRYLNNNTVQSAVLYGAPGQPVKNLGARDLGDANQAFGEYYDKLFDMTPLEVALLKSGGYSAYVEVNANNSIRARVHGRDRGPRVSDFDADGLTDIAVWRPGAVISYWYVRQSTNAAVTVNYWGLAGDVLTPADYDDDGQTDRAIARNEDGQLVWYYEPSSMFDPNNIGTGLVTFPFGLATDRAVPRDYDGDGMADVAVWRTTDATFYILPSSTKTIRYLPFGEVGDLGYPGDYDGDGKADAAVFRPSTNTFYVLKSTTQTVQTEVFAFRPNRIAPADYDGDGKWDITYIQFTTQGNRWYIRQSSNGALVTVVFNEKTLIPTPADYDGDGKDDIAGWDPEEVVNLGIWHILRSSDGVQQTLQFGLSTDQAIPASLAPTAPFFF